MVSEDELEVLEHPNKKLINGFHELMDLKVGPEQHIYNVLKLFADHHLSIVPVVDESGGYLGSISQNDLINKLAVSQAVLDPGGIIIIELNISDYSLQEIAGIVEGNDSKVLSAALTTFPNSTKAEVTIKVNKEELDGIIQTFERYGYSVKASFHESRYVDDMKDRYDEFIKYLNM
jgi:CBS domain-containing protein